MRFHDVTHVNVNSITENQWINLFAQIKRVINTTWMWYKEMYGVIKDNKLMGLYHSKDYCPRLQHELRTSQGELKTLSRTVKKTNKFYCRYCIYIEAEEKGINCYTICPQLTCLTKENLPPGLRWEIEAFHGV
jgi:hypothetical protein